jgi:3-oxoacyl-[acyl-carrier protein] reductase
LLKDQVAIITGGSSGIGRASAQLFAREGATIVILDRLREGEEVCSQINQFGGKAIFFQVDVRDRDSLIESIKTVVDQLGTIDILFSNAGINPHIGKIENTSDEQWDDIIQINLRSCFDVIRAVIPYMKAKRKGTIIATSSISGRVWAADHSVPYGVSKTGIEAIVKSTAAQYGPDGIRSNCILPGFIETPLNWITDPSVKEKIIGRIPLRRSGTPEDVAKTALFLASDLSSYVNGASIIVDGGFTL